jgi:hypothetical protein
LMSCWGKFPSAINLRLPTWIASWELTTQFFWFITWWRLTIWSMVLFHYASDIYYYGFSNSIRLCFWNKPIECSPPSGFTHCKAWAQGKYFFMDFKQLVEFFYCMWRAQAYTPIFGFLTCHWPTIRIDIIKCHNFQQFHWHHFNSKP